MDAPDSTYYSNLLISCSILPNQSINLQIKSHPSLKGKTHFFNEKNQKGSRFLKARKWSPYVRDFIFLATAYEGGWLALPHHLIFPLTVCSQCTHHSRVG